MGRVSRDAYADAFRRVTGRPLVSLPQLAGRSDSEIFFDALALNDLAFGSDEIAEDELVARYFWELETGFAGRQGQLAQSGQLLPGARAAVAATADLPGVVQSVLTGTIRPNAVAKLRADARHYDEAIPLLERAVRLQPANESAHYNLMLAYRNAGRAADAQREKAEVDKLKRPPSGEFTEFLKKLGEKAPNQ